MGDIIRRDFGKEDREADRAFARLMKIVAETEDDILANPGKHLAAAAARLAEAERFRMRLYDALHSPWAVSSEPFVMPDRLEPPTVNVDRRDYEALQAVRRIINEA